MAMPTHTPSVGRGEVAFKRRADAERNDRLAVPAAPVHDRGCSACSLRRQNDAGAGVMQRAFLAEPGSDVRTP
jgi:hypothetical protein